MTVIFLPSAEIPASLSRALGVVYRRRPAPSAHPPYPLVCLALAASATLLLPLDARANCVVDPGTLATSCNAASPNPFTHTIGAGPNTASGASVVMLVNSNITVGDANAISLGDNANIVVNSGALIQNHAVANYGLYYTGADTIEFRSNGTLTVEAGGSVLSNGTQSFAEAVNIEGSNNVVVNNGVIRGAAAAAIWFQNLSGTNTVINNVGGVIQAPTSVIGSTGNGAVVFTNRGTVIGNLTFAGGNDQLNLFTGSTLTGSFNGGGGTNQITLDGAGVASLPGMIQNFQSLLKTNLGTWTLTGTISGKLAVEVAAGTLVLAGNNSAFTGSIVVDAAGTLQGTSATLAPVIHDNGLVLFAQPQAGSYGGIISGTGALTKIDPGLLTLTGTNSYSGGTTLSGGTVAISTDANLGAPTGAIVFNTGTLMLDSNVNLLASRPIRIEAGGGTINTQAFSSTIAQAISGSGMLTKEGAGALVLSGTNTYAGGTSISGGLLQLGAGGSSGSIMGSVNDNAILAFDRADVSTFGGQVSGSGAVQQIGSGTTILTADNTYRGKTTISAGILQLGSGGTSGSILGDVLDNARIAFDRSDVLGFSGIITGSGSLAQQGTGTTILSAANTYAGPTSIEQGTLQLDGSVLSNTSVASSATLSGIGTIFASVKNAGVVAPGDPGGLGDLTIAGDYTSLAGSLALHSLINEGGPGNQITDRLLIAGNATGTTLVSIKALSGSSGGITGNSASDGISIVQVGGTSNSSSFVLNHPYVAGGPYEFQLFEFPKGVSSSSAIDPKLGALGVGSINDYRLQTVEVQASGSSVPLGLPVGQGPNGETVGQAVVLPQIPAYRIIPTASLAYGYAQVDDFHRRLGESLQEDPDAPAESFLRVQDWRGDYQGNNGPDFKEEYSFIQGGAGRLWRDLVSPGDTVHVDALGSIGHIDATVQPNGVNPNFDGYSLGASATYQAAEGWYADTVLLETLYRGIHVSTPEGPVAGYAGRGLTASLEGGYPFRLFEGTIIEPRASLAWQHLAFSAFQDADQVGVPGNDLYSLEERVGIRAQKTFASAGDAARSYSPFLSLDYYHDARGSASNTLGGVPFAVDGIGDALRMGLGMNAQLSRTWAFYGEYGRSVARGSNGFQGNQFNLGMRMTF